MNNLYKFHSYADKFVSTLDLGKSYDMSNMRTTSQATCVELSMTFMQLIPISFEVPDLIVRPDKDFYFLMFGLSFQFLLLNESLELRKFRFSMMGLDTESKDKKDYIHYPLSYSFKEFIQDSYLKFVKNKTQFIHDGQNYFINKNDQKKILEGVSYLDIIFPNEKEIFLINEFNADFHVTSNNSNGLNEGIYIYEKSRTLQQMNLLDEKFPSKQQKNKKVKI